MGQSPAELEDRTCRLPSDPCLQGACPGPSWRIRSQKPSVSTSGVLPCAVPTCWPLTLIWG